MDFLKKKIGLRRGLPLIHFLLSFFYERLIIQFDTDIDVVAAVARNQIISDGAERVLAYIISKIIACLFIFAIWHMFFLAKDHFKTDKWVRICVTVFVIGLILQILYWPITFIVSGDNFITYSYAIRLMPEYWHSMYSSCVFLACMLVVPHPIFINLVQWTAALGAMGYLICRIENSPVLKGKGKYFSFLLWTLPLSFTLLTNPYRTEVYALLCIFAVSVLVMDCIDERQRTGKELVAIIILCAFLSVWRTEGIILGFSAVFVMLVWGYRKALRSICAYMCLFLFAFLLILMPQKLGDMKYYGKDYSFINSFNTLRNILNAEDSNLTYEGAEADLEAIAAVTPPEAIQAYGMDGYRRYNVMSGRKDINQSLASDEAGKAYTKAFYNLILHNPTIYLKTQASQLLTALALRTSSYKESFTGSLSQEYPAWTYDAVDIGKEDFYGTIGTNFWNDNPIHQYTYLLQYKVQTFVRKVMDKCYITAAMVLLVLFGAAAGFLREAVLFCKKQKANIAVGLLNLILPGQFCAIVLVMPESYLVYFHACVYSTAVIVLCNILRIKVSKIEKAGENNG